MRANRESPRSASAIAALAAGSSRTVGPGASVGAVNGAFLLVDLTFFSANTLKLFEGGWFCGCAKRHGKRQRPPP